MKRSPRHSPVGRIKRRADLFIHHAWVEVGLLVLIGISVVLLAVELLTVHGPVHLWAARIGDSMMPIFWVELLIRAWVAPRKLRFLGRYWIDILAVMPVARPLRTLRVLRILRLVRAGVLMSRRLGAFRGRSGGVFNDVLALAIASSILVITAATLLVNAEPTNPSFGGFGEALWYATFSMIGGEPIGGEVHTELGRWTTLGLMIGGMTLFGLFVGTVSAGIGARLAGGMKMTRMDLDELENHVIVFGWNESGPAVLRELFGPLTPVDRAVVLVTETQEMPRSLPLADIRAEHFHHYQGDYVRIDVLEEVGVRQASTTILLTDTLVPRSASDRDARNVAAALTIERMAPDVYTVAELTSPQHTELLRMAGVEEIVVGDWFAGMIIGSATRNRGLVAVLDEVLTAQRGNSFHSVDVPQSWGGKRVQDVADALSKNHRAVLIAVGGDVNPEPDRAMVGGEKMVVLSTDKPRL